MGCSFQYITRSQCSHGKSLSLYLNCILFLQCFYSSKLGCNQNVCVQCKKQFDELQKNKQQYNYEDPYKIAIQNATRSETTTSSQNRTTNKLRGRL
jgi:hypothetical protein